jgi:hypothetical protein
MWESKNGNAEDPEGADESLETGETQEFQDGEGDSQDLPEGKENSGNEGGQQNEGNQEEDKDPLPPTGDNSERTKEGDVEVISAMRAGKTIVAVTGKPITFDKDGKAMVDPQDAEYLNSCPGLLGREDD